MVLITQALPPAENGFDLGHDLLEIGVAEGGVVAGGDDLALVILAEATTDVLDRNAFGEQVFQQHQVGGLTDRRSPCRSGRTSCSLPPGGSRPQGVAC